MDLDHTMDEMRGERKKIISLNNVWFSGGEKFHFLMFDDFSKKNTAGSKQLKKQHMKNDKWFYFKMIAGLVLLPITLIIFVVDRIILVGLVWMPMEPIQKWFDNTQKMVQTLIRIGAITFIYLIYELITWII